MAWLVIVCGMAWAGERQAAIWDATTLDREGVLRSLAGQWDYQPWDNLDDIPDFRDATSIRLPGGARRPGAYRTRWQLEDPGDRHRVMLQFEAVGYRCTVHVNGEQVGGHLGGFTPFAFDITSYVRPGENELVVLVQGLAGVRYDPDRDQEPVASESGFTLEGLPMRRGGGRSVIGYGFFPFEGIYRDVHLRVVPATAIEAVRVSTSYRQRHLMLQIPLRRGSGDARAMRLTAEVQRYCPVARGAQVPVLWRTQAAVPVHDQPPLVTLARHWSDPPLWMPGDPQLLVVTVTLRHGRTGNILDRRTVRFGFREIWTQGRQVVVNGIPMRFFIHGTLDVQAPPDQVRTIFTEALDQGFNTVRPATMVPASHFASIADEMGVVLIGESELTFNRGYAFDQPSFWQHFLRLWQERIARDRNHPSIFFWSLANEVVVVSPAEEIGPLFHETFRRLQAIDDTRLYMQEGDGDLRSDRPGSRGHPLDVINTHFYGVSLHKNPLWATEFPVVAWAMGHHRDVAQIAGAWTYGQAGPLWDRPWIVGEFGPLVSIGYPDHFVFWGGPEVYRDLFGRADALIDSIGETVVMQLQALRDLDVAGMDPWAMGRNPRFTAFLRRGFEPITVFCPERLAHGVAGAAGERRTVALNDSQRPAALRITMRLYRGDAMLTEQTRSLHLNPGERQEQSWHFVWPPAARPPDLRWVVQMSDEQGTLHSSFEQAWRVYPEISPDPALRQATVLVSDGAGLTPLARWIGAAVVPASALSESLLNNARLVILDDSGWQVLDEHGRELLDAFMRRGGVVMALGVEHLVWRDVVFAPQPLSDATRVFLDRRHLLTEGTVAKDWAFWQPDHYVSRGNIEVPWHPALETLLLAGGAGGLKFSPLMLLPVGDGVLVICRLSLAEAMDHEPMAKIFLNRLAAFARQQSDAPPRDTARLRVAGMGEHHAAILDLARAVGLDARELDLAVGLDPAATAILLGPQTPLTQQDAALIEGFVRGGGLLWLHQWQDHPQGGAWIKTLTGQEVTWQAPASWLPQLEQRRENAGHILLNGINDHDTCWATFAWTNGDIHSLHREPIMRSAARVPAGEGGPIVLLAEPSWTGQWDTSAAGGTLAEKIIDGVSHLRGRGRDHLFHPDPAAGLLIMPLGDGMILLDQLCWPDTMQVSKNEIRARARRIAVQFMRNVGQVVTSP